MAYKTKVRSVITLHSLAERFYQQKISGNGKPYWERIERVWYLELKAKADRCNTLDTHVDHKRRTVDRELFFEVSPV